MLGFRVCPSPVALEHRGGVPCRPLRSPLMPDGWAFSGICQLCNDLCRRKHTAACHMCAVAWEPQRVPCMASAVHAVLSPLFMGVLTAVLLG